MAWGKPFDVCRHGDGASSQTRWHSLRKPSPAAAGSGWSLLRPGSFPITAVSATHWAPRRTSATPGPGSAPAARASRARPATDASRVSSASPSRAAGVRKPGPSWATGGWGLRTNGEDGRAAGERKVRCRQVSERPCRGGVRAEAGVGRGGQEASPRCHCSGATCHVSGPQFPHVRR